MHACSVEAERIEKGKIKREIEKLQRELYELMKDSKRLIDLENKVIVFVDNPDPRTWARLRPIMSHDKWETTYKFTDRVCMHNGADLHDPEKVKAVISRMNVSNRTKKNLVTVYDSFLRFVGGTWQKPKYVCSRKLPFILLESEIDQLIAGCSKTISTVLQAIKETGARIGEVSGIRWEDIDFACMHFEGDEYHSSTAETVDEACKLVDAGFEYVCEINGVKVFRKRK